MMSQAEKLLVEKAKAGDSSALGDLFEVHRTYLLLFARKLVGKEFAEDILHEVVIKALKGIKRFRYQSSIKTWLCRCLVNASIDFNRSSAKKLHNAEDITENFNLRMPKTIHPVYKLALNDALSTLKPKQQEIIKLKYYEGYKAREIRKLTGKTKLTLWHREHNALKALRNKMQILPL